MSQILSEKFRAFAELECRDSSPLYYALSNSIAQDEAILDIAGQSMPGQPVPNLLMASVHYLLLSEEYSSHPLVAFYASCIPSPANSVKAYPYFRDFILRHASEVVALLNSRRVQTNEVRRCAYLLPAFLFAISHFEPRPLALVEIGTSAGLNLLWDKYVYSYGDSEYYGDASSAVFITSTFRSVIPSALSRPLPEITHRIGLDLNIVDTKMPDQATWLRALVWPEHHERRKLMDAALKRRNEMELDLRTGDGFARLIDLAKEISEESLIGVYHTHVANQISNEAKQTFLKSIEKLGAKRDIIHIFNNIKPNLHLTAYCKGQLIDLPLANTDGHARWIEWLQN
jgi:hypothetical protein